MDKVRKGIGDAVMKKPVSWNVLNDGGTHDLILASDFPATGRSIGGFADLAAAMGANWWMWETSPPPLGAEQGMTGGDYTDRWLADISELGRPVRGVLGFCVGSV